MVALQEKIQTYYQETEEARNEIIRGSDEHLDLILEIKPHIDKVVEALVAFNEGAIPSINITERDEIVDCMPRLKSIYKEVRILISKLHNSGLYHDIKSTSTALSDAGEDLHEIIYDLENYRINEDPELNDLLKD